MVVDVVGTVTVTVLVPPGTDEGSAVVLGPGEGAAVVVVTTEVTVEVEVEVLVVLAGAMTPHATRLPESPVASVCSSGPGAPFSVYRGGILPKLSGSWWMIRALP